MSEANQQAVLRNNENLSRWNRTPSGGPCPGLTCLEESINVGKYDPLSMYGLTNY